MVYHILALTSLGILPISNFKTYYIMLCPKTEFQETLFEYLQQDVISLSSNKISNIYGDWQNDFEVQKASIEHDIEIVFDKTLISNKQGIPPDAYLFGIDFPTWFNTPTDGKFKIMVLGIDPLRNEKAFKDLKADPAKSVIIGTPYALHLSKFRMGRTKHYWDFVDKLSKEHFVYLTDIYKVFFYTDKTKNERSYIYYRNHPIQENLLKKEIDLINPDLIITLGAESFTQLTKLKAPKLTNDVSTHKIKFQEKFQLLPMVHLSGSTRKNTILDFLKCNGIEGTDGKYGACYYNIVNKYLEKI